MSIIGFMQLINVATYLVDLVKKGDVKNINDYLDDYKQFPKYIIKNAMNSTDDLEIKELVGFHRNKDIMKKITNIERKKVIWRYVLKWLNKPITNDGLLGINVRIGLKHLKNLDKAPLTLNGTICK